MAVSVAVAMRVWLWLCGCVCVCVYVCPCRWLWLCGCFKAADARCSACCVGVGVHRRQLAVSAKSHPPPPEYARFGKLHPLCYAGLAGTFGAQTVTLAKSTAEVLKTTFDGDNQMIYVLTYVILGGMFCTIFLEQHWLASGLVHFDALYIVPVFQAFFIGVSVLGGAVYFQELSNFSLLQGIMFPFGVVVRALTPVVEAMVSPIIG